LKKEIFIFIFVSFFYLFSNGQVTNPSSVSGLSLWLSGDSVEVINGKVKTCFDKSENNNSAIQIDTSKQPVWVSGFPILNNQPIIAFDGVNDYLQFNNIANIKTAFFVFNHNRGYRVFDNLFGNTTNEVGSLLSGGLFKLIYYSANWLNISYLNGNSISPYDLNQDSLYNILTLFPSPDGHANTISHNGFDGYNPWHGNIAEVLFYNRILSNSERISVEQYLRNKYSPPVNLTKIINVNYGFCKTIDAYKPWVASYLWKNKNNDILSTSSSIKVNKAGIYWLTTKDIFGYSSTDSVNVNFINTNLNISNSTKICINDSINLFPQIADFNHYSFLWSTGEASSHIYAKEPKNYWVKITDSLSCFKYSDTLKVSIDSFANHVSLGKDTTLCAGNFISIVSPSNYPTPLKFLWMDGTTDSLYKINATNKIWVRVTNNNGCFGYDTILVTISGIAPQSDFSFDTVCYKNTTHFINTTKNNIDSSFWNFGDKKFSFIKNPTHIFNSAGSYFVYLTTKSGQCSNTVQKNIFVKSIPIAKFTTQETCINFPFLFIDNSVANLTDSIVSWNWKIENTIFSNKKNPLYTFISPNNYTVLLSVTSSNGCSDTTSRTINIVANAPSPEKTKLLTPQNNSIVSLKKITFSWSNSSDANKYRFIASSHQNFSDTIINTVSIDNSINLNYNLFHSDTIFWKVLAYNICNDFSSSSVFKFSLFKSTSLSGLSLWLSGDSVKVINGKIKTWYDKSGNNNSAIQLDTSKQPVWVSGFPILNNQPIVTFDGVNDYLQFNDITDIKTAFFVYNHNPIYKSYDNLFGSTTNETGSLLSGGLYKLIYYSANWLNITFLNGSSISPYDLVQDSLYTILDLVPSPDGHANTISHNGFNGYNPWHGNIAEVLFYNRVLSESERISVEQYLHFKYAPPVHLGADINIPYGFCDTIIHAGARFTKYAWNNGDTTEFIKVNKSGNYSVTATDIFGFTSSDNIIISYPQIKSKDTLICSNSTATIDAGLGNNYNYVWTNSKNTILSNNKILTTNIEDTYKINIKDTNTCEINAFIKVSVDSFPAKVSFGQDSLAFCKGSLLKLYKGSNLVRFYQWSDGSSDSTLLINTKGIYSVTITNNNNCQNADTINITIKGKKPIPDFSAEPTCLGDSTYFIDASKSDSSIITNWKWNFGNGNFLSINNGLNKNIKHQFIQSGDEMVALSVTTDQGCSDSIIKSVKIYSLPQINFLPPYGCSGSQILFQDKSSDTLGNITKRYWNFGNVNNEIDSTINPNFNHIFDTAGVYNVSLTVVSTTGCKNTLTKNIQINPSPEINFLCSDTCFGQSTVFTDNSNTQVYNQIMNWEWKYNNIIFSNLKNPNFKFNNSGKYIISMKTHSLNGCIDSITKTIKIHSTPSADFNFGTICNNTPFTFINKSSIIADTINKYTWFINNKIQSSEKNPLITFKDTGIYSVKLQVETSNGCFDSTSKKINVFINPIAKFSFSPEFGSPPLEVGFTNLSEYADTWDWFIDNDEISNEKNPSYIFNENKKYNISLIAKNIFGCKDSVSTPIFMKTVLADVAIKNVSVVKIKNIWQTTVNIANQGSTQIKILDLAASLNNGFTFHEMWNGFLKPGDTTNYVFNTLIDATMLSMSFICINAIIPGYEVDAVPENNRMCVSLINDFYVFDPYPNPAGDEINLSYILPFENDVEIIVYNMLGGKLLDNYVKGYNGYNMQKIDMSNLNSGPYLLKIKFYGQNKTIKFLKK